MGQVNVTWKYVSVTLIAICMGLLGYISSGASRETTTLLLQIQNLTARVVDLEINKARTEARYDEIIRRLDLIENQTRRGYGAH